MSPGSVSHAKKHSINSVSDHAPVTGDHDENSIVVMDANGLPVKDSGIQIGNIDTLKATITLSGTNPVNADVAAWMDGDRGMGLGTSGKVFLIYKHGTSAQYTELI